MMHIWLLFCFLCLFRSTQSQYIPFIRKPTNPCDGSSRTVLVEHFFNLIFTEFYSTPPVCVCVQMCTDQSTYCYPNGCFRRNDKKIADDLQPVSRIQNDVARAPIFLIDQKIDYVTDFMRREYSEERKIAKTDRASIKDIRPDPFKDKYKAVFKYKKIPQVELRYNLREQVKNTKTDLIKLENTDVSKTRWPLKKYSKLNGPMHPAIYDSNTPETKINKFFMSVLPDKDVVNYPPRYSKRELKTAGNTKVDMKTAYLESQTNETLHNTSFSIENLINNLIHNNFEINNAGVEINIGHSNENDEINPAIVNKTINENSQKLEDNNINTNIVFMNSTSENLDRSKYVEVFNQMISKFSKKIDIQNNTSMEMMRRVSGGVEIVQVDISNELLGNKSINAETNIYKAKNEIDHTRTTNENNVVNTTFQSNSNEIKTIKKLDNE